MKFDTRKQMIVGLLFSFGFPMLPLSKWANEFASVRHLVGYEVIWWSMVAVMLLYVHFVEWRPLSSIGFRRLSLREAGVAIAVGIFTIAGLAFIYYVVLPALHLNEVPQMNAILATPLWWRLISVVRAAVSEEVLYRGYGIERLDELSGRRRFAAIFSWAAFTFAHVGYWGWAHLLIAGFGGGMLTLLYLWRRNLWVSMIAHALIDGVGVIFA